MAAVAAADAADAAADASATPSMMALWSGCAGGGGGEVGAASATPRRSAACSSSPPLDELSSQRRLSALSAGSEAFSAARRRWLHELANRAPGDEVRAVTSVLELTLSPPDRRDDAPWTAPHVDGAIAEATAAEAHGAARAPDALPARDVAAAHGLAPVEGLERPSKASEGAVPVVPVWFDDLPKPSTTVFLESGGEGGYSRRHQHQHQQPRGGAGGAGGVRTGGGSYSQGPASAPSTPAPGAGPGAGLATARRAAAAYLTAAERERRAADERQTAAERRTRDQIRALLVAKETALSAVAAL